MRYFFIRPNRHNFSKKGQIWSIDYIIGLMLFIIMLFIAIKILVSIYPSEDYSLAYRDAVYISDNLMKEGYPINWTAADVIILGVAKNNRIDIDKLSRFSDIDYYRTKTLFHMTSDYVFFIHNSTAIINNTQTNTTQCIYGFNISVNADCTPKLETLQYSNLVKIDRVVIYDSAVVQLTVYTWN